MLSELVAIIIINTIILFQSLCAARYYCLSVRPVTWHHLCDLQLLTSRMCLNLANSFFITAPGSLFKRSSSCILITEAPCLYSDPFQTMSQRPFSLSITRTVPQLLFYPSGEQGRGATLVFPCPLVASPSVSITEDINIKVGGNDLNWKLILA